MIGAPACRVLVHLFGYLYPGYCTYKALEIKQTAVIERWCKYWLILALFTTAERMVLDWTVFWVPLYYEGKLLFVLWLWHPSSNGASVLYSRVLSPLLKQHEGAIDQSIGEAQGLVFDYVSGAVRWSIAFIKQNAYLLTGYLQALKSFRDEGAQAQVQHQGNRKPPPKPPAARAHSGQEPGQAPHPTDMPSWMYPQDHLQPDQQQQGKSRPGSRGGSVGGDSEDFWGSPERSQGSQRGGHYRADDTAHRSRSPSPDHRQEQRKQR